MTEGYDYRRTFFAVKLISVMKRNTQFITIFCISTVIQFSSITFRVNLEIPLKTSGAKKNEKNHKAEIHLSPSILHIRLYYYNVSKMFIGKHLKTTGYTLKYNKSGGTIQSSDKLCLVSCNEPDGRMTSHECDKFHPPDLVTQWKMIIHSVDTSPK